MFSELYLNIDQNCFARLINNFAKNVNEGKIHKKFQKYWLKSLKMLAKKKKIRGRYLDLLKQESKKIKDEKLKRKIKDYLTYIKHNK